LFGLPVISLGVVGFALFVAIAVLVGAGFVVGILSGLLGIGGGTLMVPLFRLGVGLSAIGATATSLFAMIPTAITGAASHMVRGTCLPRVGVCAGLAGALTSPLGVWFATKSPDWAIMLATGLVIAYSSISMIRKGMSISASTSTTDNPVLAPIIEDERVSISNRQQAIVGIVAGLIAGLLSGYVGVGGGFLMVPIFIQFGKLPVKMAPGTSLIAVMILIIPAVITQCFYGNVDYLVGVTIALGSIPGALLGAFLLKFISPRKLCFLFGAMLFVVACVLIFNEFALA